MGMIEDKRIERQIRALQNSQKRIRADMNGFIKTLELRTENLQEQISTMRAKP